MATNSSSRNTILIVLLGFLDVILVFYVSRTSFVQGDSFAIKQTSATFMDGSLLTDLSNAGDEAWRLLTTKRGGFLWVQTDVENVREGNDREEEWGISMFHGLHCLQMIRTALQEPSQQNEFTHAHHPSNSTEDAKIGTTHDSHIGHCLGYLANYLSCHPDSTLEPPVRTMTEAGRMKTNVDGIGYQHQCRDSTELWSAAKGSEMQPVKPWAWWPGQRLEDLLFTSDL